MGLLFGAAVAGTRSALDSERALLAQQVPIAEGAEDLFDGPVEGFGAVDGEGGVAGGGEDVFVGHGAGGGVELCEDGFSGAAALADVAVDAAAEAELVGGVDVDAEVVERRELGVVEREDAFDDDVCSRGTISSKTLGTRE